MGRYAEQEGVLLSLRGREDFFELPNAAQILFESGWAALQLHRASPASTDYLLRAQEALETFMNRFPGSDRYVIALLLLGEAYYNQGYDAQAYDTVWTSFVEGKRRGIRTAHVKLAFPDIYPHFGLAGHRLGKIDIVNPRTANDAIFTEEVRKSDNPAIRLEYAKLLAEARDVPGAKLQAMRHYNAVAQGVDGVTSSTAAQIFEAQSTLMRFALDDIKAGKFDPNVPYPSYAHPFDAYYDLYENSFDLGLRTKLLLGQADFHLSQGQPLKAFLLLLARFKPRFLPEEIASQLRDGLWGIVAGAMKEMRDTQDYAAVLQSYPAFAGPLADHPLRDAFLVDGAQILMAADLRADAARAIGLVGAYGDLPAPEQGRLTVVQKELRLDPADPESVKRDAPALLDPQYDEGTRARVVRLLGDVYRAEGNHAYAAQVYSQAFRYKNLPLLERMNFYEKTAREYGAAAIDGKVVETLYLAFVDLEENEDGVDFPKTGEIRGEFLLMLGDSYQRLGHLDRAARAYEEYLDSFPKGVHASSARYRLAKISERTNNPARALEQYNLLAGQQGADAFWVEAARKSADHLRWEQEHAYLAPGETRP
jgi:tetratricopeptide (TPR) repeat protein